MAYDYDQDKVDAAQYVRQAVAEGQRVYLSPFLASHSTVRVLTTDLTLASFDGHQGLVLPPADGERKAVYVFLAAWEPESATAFGQPSGKGKTFITRTSSAGISPGIQAPGTTFCWPLAKKVRQ